MEDEVFCAIVTNVWSNFKKKKKKKKLFELIVMPHNSSISNEMLYQNEFFF